MANSDSAFLFNSVTHYPLDITLLECAHMNY